VLIPTVAFRITSLIDNGDEWATAVSFTIYPRSGSSEALKQNVRAALVFRDLDGHGRRDTMCHVGSRL
jgi:hypothetical protein